VDNLGRGRIHQSKINLREGYLSLGLRPESGFTNELAAEFGQGPYNEEINANQPQLVSGQSSFFLHSTNVRTFEYQEVTGFSQRLAQHVGYLLAQRIVESIPEQRTSVGGFIGHPAQGDLAFQRWLGGLLLQCSLLRFALRGNTRSGFDGDRGWRLCRAASHEKNQREKQTSLPKWGDRSAEQEQFAEEQLHGPSP
jgi:hypothetical protein